MLIRLALQNIAIIEALELEFQAGLNVITGETGSGKSLILDAIQRVFEKKGSPKDLLRQGASRGRIELTFDLGKIHNRSQIETLLSEAGIELLPNEQDLVLGRDLTPSSTRSRINGCQVPLDLMEKLGALMLEIFGQHDLHTLFSSSRQRDLLDNMGGEPLLKVRQEVRRAYRDYQKIKTDIEALRTQQQDRERQLDFLSYQIQEITQAEVIDLAEDEQLQVERERLSHSEHLRHASLQATRHMSDEDYDVPSVLKLLSQVQKSLSAGTAIDPKFSTWSDRVSGVEEDLKALIQEMYQYGDAMDTRPERIKEIIDRLDVLEKLKRKYGGSLETVLRTAAGLEAQLDTLQQAETLLGDLETQLAQKQSLHLHLCGALSELRESMSQSLESAIQNELRDLMLPHAEFKIQLQTVSPSENGRESVTFMFSANPGESLKPLAQVASGGELSRLMLALKIRTAHVDSLTSLILDEIDTGMSGVTVRAVADKLLTLQHQCQIIVITHQPIVAAKAQWHLHVQKHMRPEGVEVTAHPLTQLSQRKAVLSQLASGFTKDDAVTAKFVDQLLA